MRQVLFGLVAIPLLASCSNMSAIEQADSAAKIALQKARSAAVDPYVISLGRDGELEDVSKGVIREKNPGFFEEEQNTYSFDNILRGIEKFPKDENGVTEVLIYVHGGLNTEKGALKRAKNKYYKVMCLPVDPNASQSELLIEAKKNESCKPKYPIFVNWRSGPFSTYGAHLGRIRQGEISESAPLTSPIYLLTDIANSLVNTPKSWLVMGEHSLKSTLLKGQEYTNMLTRLETYKGGKKWIHYTGGDDNFSTLSRNLQWLVTSPAKAVTTPFTYTLARPAWDIMLRRTNTPFYSPDDFKIDGGSGEFAIKQGSGGLYKFLMALHERLNRKERQLSVKITLVGHSMGAIIVNKMLSLDVDLPYKNIVHMASADSINNLFKHVLPYLNEKNKITDGGTKGNGKDDVKFYSLSLHPETENREASAKGLTPSGSLLVWIDNIFTTPETVQDLRSGRWANMERVLPLIPENAKKHMRFKIFGLSDLGNETGPIKNPMKHGDFGNTAFWLEETWK